MRTRIALSFALLAAAAACGGRTEVDDLSTPNHNATLTGGAAGASTGASGKGGSTPGNGGNTSAAGGATSTAGNGTVGLGGSTTTAGGASAVGGSSSPAGGASTGKGGTTSAGGKAGAGTAGTGTAGTGTSTGGASTSTGGTGAGAFGGACNPVDQATCKPGEKCSALQSGGPMGSLQTGCVTSMGAVAEGQDCKRTSIGHDNCATGLICTGVGVIDYDANKMPPHRQCRRFCQQDSDCGMTQGCANFTQDGFGVCVDSCLPFSACDPAPPNTMGTAGNNGGSNLTCASVQQDIDQQTNFFSCHTAGKGQANTPCQQDVDCAAGFICTQGGGGPGGTVCSQLCDETHACSDMKQMCSSGGMGLGICQ